MAALIELLQLITEDNVAALLNKLPYVAEILPCAAAVLAVAETFLPENGRKSAVTQSFENLSKQLEKEKRELVNIIQMEALNVRYGEHIVSIQTAIHSWGNIARAMDGAQRRRYIKILRDVCEGQKHTLAIDNLIEGLRGVGTLQINIMDHYYTHTNGHLPMLRSIAKELLLLVYGGFIVMCTYETLMHDQSCAEAILSEYTDRMRDVKRNIERVFDRCKNESSENMLRHLNEVLDSNVSNSEAVNSMSSLMSEKYDWLEHYCIVCNETLPVDCWFEGNYVQSCGQKGRFGVVFYQDTKRAAVVGPARRNHIARILEKFTSFYWIIPDAKELCQQLTETLRINGIETCGCAVIKPNIGLVYRSLYTIFPSLLNYENTMGFQKKGNSLITVHCCSEGYILGPKEIHFVIQYKQTTTGFVSNGNNVIAPPEILGMQHNARPCQNAIRLAIDWR